MSVTVGQAAYKLSFQLSPIILTGGIAQFVPGGLLPIIAITEALNFVTGLLGESGDNLDLDNFFANFVPVAGATIVDNQYGRYPFANQAVAANAIIAQPLRISMLMICPARNRLGYAAKTATMMALQSALTQHNASGGTYVVATPSYIYTDCIMTGMSDASNPESKQLQNAWRIDFEEPLLTLQAAQQAQGNLLSKITNGVQVPSQNGVVAWSGLAQTVGSTSGAPAPTVAPMLTGPVGTGTAPVIGFIE